MYGKHNTLTFIIFLVVTTSVAVPAVVDERESLFGSLSRRIPKKYYNLPLLQSFILNQLI